MEFEVITTRKKVFGLKKEFESLQDGFFTFPDEIIVLRERCIFFLLSVIEKFQAREHGPFFYLIIQFCTCARKKKYSPGKHIFVAGNIYAVPHFRSFVFNQGVYERRNCCARQIPFYVWVTFFSSS